MAYSWEVGSTPTFRALSYEDWAKPLREATEYHKDIEQQYADLDAQASVWEKLANDAKGTNSEAYKLYKNYSDELRYAANNFATRGLTYNSRKHMLDMRSRYAKEILPIQEAWEKRERLHDMYQKNLIEHPELLQLRDPGKESIDAFVANPNWTYESVNMNQLYSKVQGEAAAYAKQILSDLDNIKKTKKEGEKITAEDIHNAQLVESPSKWYLQYIIKKGYSPDQIAQALSEDGDNAIKAIVQSAVLASNIDNMEHGYSYSSEDEKNAYKKNNVNRLMNYLQGATLAAVGDETLQLVENKEELMKFQAAENAKDRAVKWASIAAANAGKDKEEKSGVPFTTMDSRVVGNPAYNSKHDEARMASGIYKTLSSDDRGIFKTLSKSELNDFMTKVKVAVGGDKNIDVASIDFDSPSVEAAIQNIAKETFDKRNEQKNEYQKQYDEYAAIFKRLYGANWMDRYNEFKTSGYNPDDATEEELRFASFGTVKDKLDRFNMTNGVGQYGNIMNSYVKDYTYNQDEASKLNADEYNNYVYDASAGNRKRSAYKTAQAGGMTILGENAITQTLALYDDGTPNMKNDASVTDAQGKKITGISKADVSTLLREAKTNSHIHVEQKFGSDKRGLTATFRIYTDDSSKALIGKHRELLVDMPPDAFIQKYNINAGIRGTSGSDKMTPYQSNGTTIDNIQAGIVDILSDVKSGGRFSKSQQNFINYLVDKGLLTEMDGSTQEKYDGYTSQLEKLLENSMNVYTTKIAEGQNWAYEHPKNYNGQYADRLYTNILHMGD